MPGGQLASVAHGQWGPLGRRRPAPGPHSCPGQSRGAPTPTLLSLPPARGINQGRDGGPGEKPTSPLQTKPQGAGFQEGKVHLQETEPGQRENPGRPHGQGALGKKG